MSSDSQNIVGIYQRHAEAWMRNRSKSLIEKDWLDKFLKLLPANPSVLDLGCGFGEPIGRYLLENGCKVTGTDTSEELLNSARKTMPEATWITADIRTLELEKKFDGILAWNSTFHLTQDDQRAMFAVFEKHAADEAALMFTSGPKHGEAIGEFEGEPLYHSSLDEAEYRSLLNNHGFEVVEHVVEDPNCGKLTVWLARA